jgi:hypothetical protein
MLTFSHKFSFGLFATLSLLRSAVSLFWLVCHFKFSSYGETDSWTIYCKWTHHLALRSNPQCTRSLYLIKLYLRNQGVSATPVKPGSHCYRISRTHKDNDSEMIKQFSVTRYRCSDGGHGVAQQRGWTSNPEHVNREGSVHFRQQTESLTASLGVAPPQ